MEKYQIQHRSRRRETDDAEGIRYRSSGRKSVRITGNRCAGGNRGGTGFRGMKVGYMYSFLMQHTHRSFKGIFGVCISVAALAAFALSFDGSGDTTRKVILLIIGLLFTVVNPIILLIKAQQQVLLSPVYKNPLIYLFTEDGMTVSQGEQEQSLAWNAILEVRKTASVLIIYTAKNSASILAYKEMGEKRQAVEEMIARGCKKAGITKIPASMEKDA